MEIKRSLEKLAKRMSPQIEVMNVSTEIRKHIKRIEELTHYAQTKIDRSAERKKMKADTIGAAADKARKRQDAIVAKAQQEESDKNLADQKEASEERNKKPGELPDIPKISASEPVDPKPVAKKKANKKK